MQSATRIVAPCIQSHQAEQLCSAIVAVRHASSSIQVLAYILAHAKACREEGKFQYLKRNQGHHCRQVPEACLTERKVDEGMECHEAAANVNSITVGRPQAGDVGAIAVMKPVEVLVQRLHIMEKGVYKVKPCIVCHHCDPVYRHRSVKQSQELLRDQCA